MSTLPTLPTCKEPATVRIELYTEDSLDACAYACTGHTIRTTTAFSRVGLETHPTDITFGVKRPCGYVYVFPTGTLAAEPAELNHPRWCDRDDCQRRGRHRCRARHVDNNRPEAFILDVALVQALHAAAEPMVNLTSVAGSTATSLVLSNGQARALRYRLTHLLDLAKAGHNGGRWA